MEVRLAKTAGFCMGVRRAVDIVLEIAQHETGRRIYTYGPLIHNPQTVELLRSRGIIPVGSVDEITDRENAVLVIRAHGIAPSERKKIKESGIKIIDATCPKVGYVQAIIKKHTALDYTVVIVGDKEHPEVDGLLGYTAGRGIIIANPEDVERCHHFPTFALWPRPPRIRKITKRLSIKSKSFIRRQLFLTPFVLPQSFGRRK